MEAHAAGLRLFGENRVQEWQEKSSALSHLADAEIHLIGPLQSNKTAARRTLRRHRLGRFAEDRDAPEAAAAALGKKLPILIEVKLSHEESKHGIAPQNCPRCW